MRGKNHADGALAEGVHLSPDHAADIKTFARIAQPVFSFFCTVVDLHAEAAGQSEDDLFQFLVRVAAALGIHRDIIEIINSGDIEGDMRATLNEGQIATWIVDLWQVEYTGKALDSFTHLAAFVTFSRCEVRSRRKVSRG